MAALDASGSVAYFTFAKFGFILGYEPFNHHKTSQNIPCTHHVYSLYTLVLGKHNITCIQHVSCNSQNMLYTCFVSYIYVTALNGSLNKSLQIATTCILFIVSKELASSSGQIFRLR